MEVVSHSPLPVGSLFWQSRPSVWTFTFIAKATCQLQLGKSPLAASQEPVFEEDRFHDGDENRSLFAPSDIAPFKQRADVTLVGSAYSPQGQSVRSLFARLIVGDVDKSIEVVQDQTLAADGVLVDGTRFVRMPLMYERAAGGPDTTNPVGVRCDVRDAYGRVKLPNLRPPGTSTPTLGAVIPPVAFAPIAARWPLRATKLGRLATSVSYRSLAALPLPDDLHPSFFNVAPPDQQVPDLLEDARLVLENMHPQASRFVTNLPGLRPRAVLEGRGGSHPLPMRLDHLWIDTDRGLVTLTFRGQLKLERIDEPGRILITLAEATNLAQAPAAPSSSPVSTPAPESNPRSQPRFTTVTMGVVNEEPAALPFASAPQPNAPSPSMRDERVQTGLPFMNPGARPAAPAALAQPAAPQLPISQPPLSQPPIAPPPIPPAIRPPPPPPSAPGVVATDSVWASGISRPEAPSSGQSIGQVVAAAVAAAAQATTQDGSAGVVGASNAAAGPQKPASGNREDDKTAAAQPGFAQGIKQNATLGDRDVLRLIWYEPNAVPNICKVPVWHQLLEKLEQRAADEGIHEPSAGKDPVEIEDRRDIFEILARGASQDIDQLGDELQAAVRPGNKFVPSLLLLAGELFFPFDERDSLKAALAVAAPVAGSDELLKTAVRDAREFLAAPEQLSPVSVAESFTIRIREAFLRAKKGVGPQAFDTPMERLLLEGRMYQKRQILGMNAIRAFLATTTGSSTIKPAPVYLPAELASNLPLYQRFRARLIVELYMQEDQFESHPAALKAVALGRLFTQQERR